MIAHSKSMHLPLACKAAIPKRETLRPDTLTTRLAGFEKIPVPSGCQEIQPFFAKAKKKMDTIYALMIQILGDGQYTNDDMANLTALKTAAGVFAESYQFGLGLLEQALDR